MAKANELDIRLCAIGFRFSEKSPNRKNQSIDRGPKNWIDIEGTLIDACYEVSRDARLLSFLMGWIQVHGDYVVTEKLMKQARNQAKERGQCRWLTAVAAFAAEHGQHKWKRLIARQKTPLFLHAPELVESAIRLKGREDFLARQNIFVAKGSLRIRESDVLSPEQLANINLQYRNRYLYGASWRADIITAIESGFENPFQISKTIGCSYEPAHRVFNEYRIAKNAG